MKKVLIATGYIIFMFLMLLYSQGFYLTFLLETFSKVRYNADFLDHSFLLKHLLVLTYCTISWLLNNRMFNKNSKGSLAAWSLHWFIDLLLIPAGVLIMILYNNNRLGMINLSTVENMLIPFGLLLLKQLFTMTIRKKDSSLPASPAGNITTAE